MRAVSSRRASFRVRLSVFIPQLLTRDAAGRRFEKFVCGPSGLCVPDLLTVSGGRNFMPPEGGEEDGEMIKVQGLVKEMSYREHPGTVRRDLLFSVDGLDCVMVDGQLMVMTQPFLSEGLIRFAGTHPVWVAGEAKDEEGRLVVTSAGGELPELADDDCYITFGGGAWDWSVETSVF